MLDWQAALTYDIMAVDDEGLWVHQKFGYSVPRRNGKSEMALARCVWGLANGERILYTAHRTSTAHAIWDRLARLCPKVGVNITSSFKAFGKEHLYTEDSTIEFRTRTSSGGLGEGYDVLIVDEAQEYTPEQETALKYVVTDSANPQTIYFGTPPTAISAGTVFPKFRKNVLHGNAYSSGWAEWSIPEMVSHIDDVDLWYETNPSLGTVLKERTIRSEIGDDITDFNIQRLGLWIKYNQKSAISRNEWEALQVSKLPELTGQLFAGIKFGVDGNNAVLSIAVRTKDSRIFCEVVGCRPIRDGVGWLVDFLRRADVRKCVVDGKNGADVLIDACKDAKIKHVETVNVQQFIKANSVFDMAMENGTFCHMQQSAVTQVVSNCERRKIGAYGGLGYQSLVDGMDIALLDSMILAHWICSDTKAEKKKQNIDY
jgi:phage terminase large subunit-like protein